MTPSSEDFASRLSREIATADSDYYDNPDLAVPYRVLPATTGPYPKPEGIATESEIRSFLAEEGTDRNSMLLCASHPNAPEDWLLRIAQLAMSSDNPDYLKNTDVVAYAVGNRYLSWSVLDELMAVRDSVREGDPWVDPIVFDYQLLSNETAPPHLLHDSANRIAQDKWWGDPAGRVPQALQRTVLNAMCHRNIHTMDVNEFALSIAEAIMAMSDEPYNPSRNESVDYLSEIVSDLEQPTDSKPRGEGVTVAAARLDDSTIIRLSTARLIAAATL